MIANINVRVLGNKHIFVQYWDNGHARDAGFNSWAEFIIWLKATIAKESAA